MRPTPVDQKHFTVIFQPFGKRVLVPSGHSLSLAAAENGIPLAADCGGNGTCGRCLVEVSKHGKEELEGAPGAKVLACRYEVGGDVTVTLPLLSLLPRQRLNLEGYLKKLKPDAASKRGGVPLAGNERPLGLAVDLGSTKIAAYLLELSGGRELARLGAMNPQIPFGEDIVARLSYAAKSADNARRLAELTVEALNGMIATLASEAGVRAERIFELCIVGNTAMTHLLLGLPVAQLARAPYRPATLLPLDLAAADIGLKAAPGARLHVPGSIGGFIGSDHLAMILATGLDRNRAPALGIDIGTNTEIILSVPSRRLLISASCASGPAFEGAHITHGMRAATGAIESIGVRAGKVRVSTIDDAPAIGLCGSGIIDGVAALLKLGLLDEKGHLAEPGGLISVEGRQKRWVIVDEAASATGKPIWLSQGDVTRIQLAKAAVEAGIQSLLSAARVGPEEVSKVIVAGAFGSSLNLASAEAIGLIPRFPNSSVLKVGNAAGAGARAILLSRRARGRAERILKRAAHLDLTGNSSFKKFFARSLRFSGATGRPRQ